MLKNLLSVSFLALARLSEKIDSMSFLSPYRREVLVLYRDILRASRAFTWANEEGKKWGGRSIFFSNLCVFLFENDVTT